MQPTHEYEVRDQMLRVGIECPLVLIPDGKIRRFKVGGRGKANGWYWLVERDGKLYGSFGDWKTQVSRTVGAYDQTMRKLVRERAVAHNDDGRAAALRAREVWAGLVPSGESAYLTRKGVMPFGLRFDPNGNYVAVPMMRDDLIVGLQMIDGDGTKMFTKGCVKRGAHFLIKGTGKCVAFVEGYATGASVHMATGFDVVVCFDAGNMIEVARALKTTYPYHYTVIVCGDNDYKTVCLRHSKRGLVKPHEYKVPLRNCTCNPGKRSAMLAARALGCAYVLPTGIKGTDFNDLHKEAGLIEVAGQIHDAL